MILLCLPLLSTTFFWKKTIQSVQSSRNRRRQRQQNIECTVSLIWFFLVHCCLNKYNDIIVIVQANLHRHSVIQTFATHYPAFLPDVVLDIGANGGMYSKALRSVYPNTTKILLFEASEQHRPKLEYFVTNDQNRSEYYITVLSSKDNETVQFYDTKYSSSGNSMFQEQTKFFENVQPISKITTTVDTVVTKQSQLTPGSNIDIIKIDVQGAELLVLQGATIALQQATVIQFEGSTVEYNIGGSCWYQVDHYLRLLGFFLYDLGDLFYHEGLFKTLGVGQLDVLYINPTSEKYQKYIAPTELDKQPKYCGVGRNPYDLPGISSQLQQELASSTQTTTRQTRTTKDESEQRLHQNRNNATVEGIFREVKDGDSSSFVWYSGFITGTIITIFLHLLFFQTLQRQLLKITNKVKNSNR